MKRRTTVKIAYIGMMAALVFTASMVEVTIPTAAGSTRLHIGNAMCLLAGMLLGPVQGGAAAGTGSMLFDLTHPAYIGSAPFTFLFKFIMAAVCGKVSRGGTHGKGRYLAGSVLGSAAYILLYLSKTVIQYRFVLGMPMEGVLFATAQKAFVSCGNALAACLVAVPLGLALRPVVKE